MVTRLGDMGNSRERVLPSEAVAPSNGFNHEYTRHFGLFELDLRAGELRRHGRKVKLQEQPFQVLSQLLEKPGQLVTREELRSRLWPADTFVDFDHSLHNAVGRVREVLGDSAEKPRYIETLPRRGYRFIASVEEVGAATPELVQKRPETLAVDTDPSEKSFLNRRTLFAAVIVLVCVGSAIWLLSGLSRSGDKPLPIHSIAVLPLD